MPPNYKFARVTSPENPTHQGAHVLPSTLVISLLLIIVVLLTIYCLR